jgi:hypothetical protein
MPPVLMTWPERLCDWFFKSSNVQTRLETPGVESRPSVAECHTRCGPETSSHRLGTLACGCRVSSGDYLPSHAHDNVSTGVQCVRGRSRRKAIARGPLLDALRNPLNPLPLLARSSDGCVYGGRYVSGAAATPGIERPLLSLRYSY